MPPTDGGRPPVVDGSFFCVDESCRACLDNKHFYCVNDGEFLRPANVDCGAMGLVCVQDLWCVMCAPERSACDGNTVIQCSSDGSSWSDVEECALRGEGWACDDGRCVNLCEAALANRSYLGCEFYAADLDNASIGAGRDASAQQYAVVVSNPNHVATEVVVEINEAPYGSAPSPTELLRVRVPPGDLEVLALPRREVDGSSSNADCMPSDRTCPGSEVCVCSRMDRHRHASAACAATANGMNDGTHTAVTSQAYHIRSEFPIIAYQFNPLDNYGVFSNDASLLLPTSAIGNYYSVVAWPQTIANSDTDPDQDFDPSRNDEDLRATLTIVGTAAATSVDVTLGTRIVRMVGAGPVPELGPGGTFTLDIGPFDVINLETQGFNADFTGTVIDASQPVSVFVGSEACDVPRFDTYATRQCCADHLEEQIWPDQSLGTRFIIARMPRRTVALNNAFVDPLTDSVAEPNEPEWVRVLATAAGTTTLRTTLPFPDDVLTIDQLQSVIYRADQDFILEADKPIAVMQALPSQEAVGIPSDYPGGDPALIFVPPVEQYRRDYVFLTPSLYAFDFVTITAPYGTQHPARRRSARPDRVRAEPRRRAPATAGRPASRGGHLPLPVLLPRRDRPAERPRARRRPERRRPHDCRRPPRRHRRLRVRRVRELRVRGRARTSTSSTDATPGQGPGGAIGTRARLDPYPARGAGGSASWMGFELERGLTLLTRNARDFRKVPGLKIRVPKDVRSSTPRSPEGLCMPSPDRARSPAPVEVHEIVHHDSVPPWAPSAERWSTPTTTSSPRCRR